ncbi:MAG: hypothetical protein A4E69_02628 [Syntrophus sp. PtaB.Bin138]|nr:MAG: hypothetical protein A4E69_02628 [Syntrophus sp. PtaB.Bin138]
MHVGLNADQKTLLLQVGHDVLPAFVAVLALVGAAVFVDGGVSVHNVDDFQRMPFGHGKVGGVGGRRDFHRPGTEIHGHVVIGNDGNSAVHQGKEHVLADNILVADIVGVNGHRRIAQHRFRTGGRHDDLTTAVGKGVADVPEGAGFLLVLHFQIGDGGVAAGAPVDDVIPLIDQILIVEADKNFPDGTGEPVVHGEPLTLPVAGASQPLQLIDDDPAEFGLPLPDPIDELLPAEIMACQPLPGQFLFHYVLGGDACMVHSRHPEGIETLHALEADDDVLKRVVQGMPHVEDSRHIGRRDHNGERRFFPFVLRMKKAGIQPVLVPSFLNFPRFIRFA